MKKVRKTIQGPWSRTSDAILGAEYGRKRLLSLARSLQRTEALTRRRFEQLFPIVPASPEAVWTPEHEAALPDFLGMSGADTISRALRVPEDLVQARLEALKAARSSRPWTHAEDRLLVEVYGHRHDEGLSLLFTRPVEDVQQRAKELAVAKDKAYRRAEFGASSTRMPRWTEEQYRILREMYPTFSNLEIARRIGRSLKSVTSTGHKLGLKKSEERMREMGKENIRHRYPRSKDAHGHDRPNG
jgi:hypothetical protein